MSDVRAAAIGGIIAVVGLLGGTYVEKWMDKDNFDHSFLMQSRNNLVEQRFQIISEFSRQVNSSDYTKILHGWNEIVGSIGPIATQWCNDNSSNELESFNCLHEKVMASSLKYRYEISEKNSAFVSTIQKSGLIFGPKTKESISKISKEKWWDTEEAIYVEVLESMRDEVYYFE